MKNQSAAVLVYKFTKEGFLVFLVHPGGPFWAKKDFASWSFPKGLFDDSEDPLEAAKREFFEETGQEVDGEFQKLTPCKQPSRKVIHTWAIEGDVNADAIRSNEFELEWPPKSGKTQMFPEVDKGAWFGVGEARKRLLKGQVPILNELVELLGVPDEEEQDSLTAGQGELPL